MPPVICGHNEDNVNIRTSLASSHRSYLFFVEGQSSHIFFFLLFIGGTVFSFALYFAHSDNLVSHIGTGTIKKILYVQDSLCCIGTEVYRTAGPSPRLPANVG